MTKTLFTEEERDRIVSLYKRGESLIYISDDLNTSVDIVRRILKEEGVYELPRKRICPTCKKLFTASDPRQKYCKNPCKHVNPFSVLRYKLINSLRAELFRLMKSNPSKAKRIIAEMKKEEGEEFTKFAINGMEDSKEFKKLLETQKKYKHLWRK